MNLVGATLAAWLASAALGGALHTDGPYFKDAQGRVVVLRGVNLAGDSKVPPFTSMKPEDLAPLPGWGVNVLRLLFIWEAYEPRPGAYNSAYLDYLDGIVRAAATQGMYVIVDFHQDGMARTMLSGCGEGFPDWAVPASAPRSVPDNGPQCVNWGMKAVVDQDMHRAWNHFFRGEGAGRAHYITMAGRVAKHFAGVANVIGYDLLNEPWGDEATDISAFYEDVARAIRAADTKSILFVAPHAVVSSGVQTDLPKPSFGNFAYAPHFYDQWIMGLQVWIGNSLSWSFTHMRDKGAEWNVPVFIGEYGAGVQARRVAGYMQMLHQRMDEGMMSGAQWVYTPGWSAERKDGWNDEDLSIANAGGAWRDNFKPRPYVQAVAGTPVQMWASDEGTLPSNVFDFTWNNDPSLGRTEIFLPQGVFFGDAQMRLETSGQEVLCSHDAQRVMCISPRPGTVRVRITAVAGDKV